jgi:hypothetical protein
MKASIRIDVSDLPDEESKKTSEDDSSQMKRRFWYGSPAQLPSIHDRRVYPVYTGRWLELYRSIGKPDIGLPINPY